jgi:hypothetical protein
VIFDKAQHNTAWCAAVFMEERDLQQECQGIKTPESFPVNQKKINR